MDHTPESTFPRRKFLKGAVGAFGASVVGFGPLAALAELAKANATTLAFWDGVHLIPAERLVSGDNTLTSVRLGIRGYNSVGGSMKAIQANFYLSEKGAPAHVPFNAWIAPPAGVATTRYLQPVDSIHGIVLNLSLQGTSSVATVPLRFVTGTQSLPKLREGHFVLMAGAVDMSQFSFDPSNAKSPLSRNVGTSAIPQYVVFDIVRA